MNKINYKLLFLVGIFLCSNMLAESKPYDYYNTSKPFTRWWWFASVIDTNDIKYQLDWLSKNNFGGTEIAWVYPYGTDSLAARNEWLSKEWSSVVAFAKMYSDKLGLGCDFTFGTLWPFGDSFIPPEEGQLHYGDSISPMRRRITWEHPKKFRTLNHMDKKALSNYSKRVGGALSEAMKGTASGLFCDSWEVDTRKIWTLGFDKKFQKKYGYDIKQYIDSIYSKGYEDIYYDYMKLVSDYVLYEFYKPFTEISNKLGGFSRSQCGGSPTDLLTAFSLVDIPESEAILYEPNYSKIPASAALLSSRNIVSAETFTCIYGWKRWPGPGPYQKKEQTADLKLVADALFANGVNHIFWHGMPFNGKGDTNIFYASVHVGENSSLTDELPGFNKYMEKVSAYMRKGKLFSDIAVYMPLEDSWMAVEYPDSLKFPWVWGQYEMRYIRTPEFLQGYQPLWVNNYFLKKANIKNGKAYIGDAEFSALFIDVKYIDYEALKTIEQLANKGLILYLINQPMQPGKVKTKDYEITLGKLLKNKNVKRNFTQKDLHNPLVEGKDLPDYWVRVDKEDYYIFIAHPMAKNLKYPLKYGQSFTKNVYVKDVKINIGNTAKEIKLVFKPYQSLLLKIDKSGNYEFVDITFNPKIPKAE